MRDSRKLLTSAAINSAGTLASRVLGMLRDMATAALFGLSSGALDALILAFRIPNLFRSVFGEGALAAGYLPMVTKQLQNDHAAAWRLATSVFFALACVLGLITLAGEIMCWWLLRRADPASNTAATLELCAWLLPYLLVICLAAQVAATLQSLKRFAVAAVAPLALSTMWLAAVCWIAPRYEPDRFAQARVVAMAILLSGVVQLAVQIVALVRLGFRPILELRSVWQAARDLAVRLGPIALGMATTRISTLMDSLLAWSLAADPGGTLTMAWTGHRWTYPLEAGAAGALYCAERLCHFPIGLLGIAVATAAFPWLSRHAAGQHAADLASDLTYALRIVLWLGIPASAGLLLLAEPLTQLIFERGQFVAADTLRTARLIQAYAIGVWAWCALPVLLRGFYAVDDRSAPLKAALVILLADLVLNLVLIGNCGELALPLSTAAGGMLQLGLLSYWFTRRVAPLGWSTLGLTAVRSSAATVVMLAAGKVLLLWLPTGASLPQTAARVLVPLVACLAIFAGCFCMSRERGLLSEPTG